MSGDDQSYKRARLRGDLESPFDAIVIGSGAGGLCSAALLALDGQRVLVLERHAVAGGCLQVYKRNGYEWDVGLHYVGEVHREGTLSTLFNKVSRGRLKWARMPEIYNRIAIGDAIFDYHAGSSAFKARMKEYFPAEASAIDRYIELVNLASKGSAGFFAERALPPSQADGLYAQVAPTFMTWAGRTVLDVLRELTSDETLIAVLCGHFGDYAALPEQASFAAHAMVIRHYLDGASYPIGGAQGVADGMADTVRSAGGLVLVGAEVARLIERGGQVHAVEMADGFVIEAKTVISSIGIRKTLDMLPADLESCAPLRWASSKLPLTLGAVVLNVGLNKSNQELGVGPANIWIHRSAQQGQDWKRYVANPAQEPMPLHFISQPSAKDPTWAERYPGRSTMDICSFTDWRLFEPYTQTQWKRRGQAYEDLKQRLTAEMLEQVYRFYPSAKGHVDYTELATPLSFNHFLNRSQGDFMSYSPTPQRYAQRWMRAHSPVKGLYFSGQDVSMGGVSGAMVGGLLAASAVLKRDLFRELRP
ncbi:NAD(P)/FAD-dependent oxidoreductase (plasmid) [Acidovorax sp. DW039]|uniref:phytoene desaturase family protein n=1 Tax=Acidovorax sp. DW039 TaxID=3095606 RepID=UPI00308EFFE7|nr:NAD(P)/FAD-dependent oxidoreductase [Acidovorax sp. DW039]